VSVNGVYRGGYFSPSYGYATRARSGYKTGVTRSYENEAIGFRFVDGVTRGGYYSATYGHATLCRSAYRLNRIKTYVNASVGFRLGCEWCISRELLCKDRAVS